MIQTKLTYSGMGLVLQRGGKVIAQCECDFMDEKLNFEVVFM